MQVCKFRLWEILFGFCLVSITILMGQSHKDKNRLVSKLKKIMKLLWKLINYKLIVIFQPKIKVKSMYF